MAKLRLEIYEVENGFLVFTGEPGSEYGFARPKYVAKTVEQLTDLVEDLAFGTAKPVVTDGKA